MTKKLIALALALGICLAPAAYAGSPSEIAPLSWLEDLWRSVAVWLNGFPAPGGDSGPDPGDELGPYFVPDGSSVPGEDDELGPYFVPDGSSVPGEDDELGPYFVPNG